MEHNTVKKLSYCKKRLALLIIIGSLILLLLGVKKVWNKEKSPEDVSEKQGIVSAQFVQTEKEHYIIRMTAVI